MSILLRFQNFADLDHSDIETSSFYDNVVAKARLETTAAQRAEALKSFVGSAAAKGRYEKVLVRVDEARLRREDSQDRAASVESDPLSVPAKDGLKVRTTTYEDGPISQMQEFSNGKRITHERDENSASSRIVIQDPDGTRTTNSSSGSWPSQRSSQTVESPDGSVKRTSSRSMNDEYEINSGSIEHADGAFERWTDDTVDFSTVTTFEDKNGKVTKSGADDDDD